MEPQVFNLLLHLVRNRGRIVSKDELIETVWNGRIVSEAALSSRINAARKAIGDTGNDQLFIRTLHKRGFRFVGEVSDGAPSIVGPSETEAESGPRRDAAEQADASPGASRPSIAVLPFDNFGGNAEGDYFSYGMTEDIIRLLARNRWLTVISRHPPTRSRAAWSTCARSAERSRCAMYSSAVCTKPKMRCGLPPSWCGGGRHPAVDRDLRSAARGYFRHSGGDGPPDRCDHRAGVVSDRTAARSPQAARQRRCLGWPVRTSSPTLPHIPHCVKQMLILTSSDLTQSSEQTTTRVCRR